jgi:hypothetical protein
MQARGRSDKAAGADDLQKSAGELYIHRNSFQPNSLPRGQVAASSRHLLLNHRGASEVAPCRTTARPGFFHADLTAKLSISKRMKFHFSCSI